MHIGFLTTEYPDSDRPDGGLATYIRKTAWALSRVGHQATVFLLGPDEECRLDGPVRIHGVKRATTPSVFRRYQFASTAAQYLSSVRIARAVGRLHATTPLSVIQAPSYFAPGYSLRRNGDIPIVCRVSSYTPLWRAAYGSPRKIDHYLSDWMEIRQIGDADAAFAPSRFIADALQRLEAFSVDVVRTPIREREVTPDPSVFNEYFSGKRYLLFFGTLSRIKGVDLIGDAIPKIALRHPNLYFGFVGRDDGFYRLGKVVDWLKRQAGPYADRVIHHAALPKDALFPIIENAEGVLLPSRVDNYPNACLEAQSLGVPVVCSDQSSIDEMVCDGRTGFVTRNGDPDSLIEGIERLLAMSETERQQMRSRIDKAVLERQSEDRIGQLIEYYEATIATFQRSRA